MSLRSENVWKITLCMLLWCWSTLCTGRTRQIWIIRFNCFMNFSSHRSKLYMFNYNKHSTKWIVQCTIYTLICLYVYICVYVGISRCIININVFCFYFLILKTFILLNTSPHFVQYLIHLAEHNSLTISIVFSGLRLSNSYQIITTILDSKTYNTMILHYFYQERVSNVFEFMIFYFLF